MQKLGSTAGAGSGKPLQVEGRGGAGLGAACELVCARMAMCWSGQAQRGDEPGEGEPVPVGDPEPVQVV